MDKRFEVLIAVVDSEKKHLLAHVCLAEFDDEVDALAWASGVRMKYQILPPEMKDE